MYEGRKQKLLSPRQFARRVSLHGLVAFSTTLIALGIGMTGYRFLGHLPWIDAFLNASMILGGMGPVDTLSTSAAKLFAGCYALFSGLVFIGISGILIAPFAHRVLHRFHIDEK